MNTELKAVLAECNRIRKTLGLPPRRRVLKGVRFNGKLCPVAKTIGSGHMGCGYGWSLAGADRPYEADGSPVLIRFAEDFDAGEYPELEAKP